MSSKRKSKVKQTQKVQQPTVRIQDAEQAMARGDLVKAHQLAEAALRGTHDPAGKQATHLLLAEILLRLGAAQDTASARLPLLTQAVVHAPQQARLHYQRGLALWRIRDFAQAARAFDLAAQYEPARPGLQFLRQVANLATGQPVQTDGLDSAEANTLALLQAAHKQGNSPRVLANLAGKPLVGSRPELWVWLLEMLANPKATTAPPTGSPARPNAVVDYYAGVAAMRQGDAGAAQPAWRAAVRNLKTPWLTQNLLALVCEQATSQAQNQQWQAVVDLFEATSKEIAEAAQDTTLGEIAGIAYFNLGYEAAQNNQWAIAAPHFRAANQLIKSRQLFQNLALAEEALQNWLPAADAWREMIRRRPRKADHPDALSDPQVAAIWRARPTVILALKSSTRRLPVSRLRSNMRRPT